MPTLASLFYFKHNALHHRCRLSAVQPCTNLERDLHVHVCTPPVCRFQSTHAYSPHTIERQNDFGSALWFTTPEHRLLARWNKAPSRVGQRLSALQFSYAAFRSRRNTSYFNAGNIIGLAIEIRRIYFYGIVLPEFHPWNWWLSTVLSVVQHCSPRTDFARFFLFV